MKNAISYEVKNVISWIAVITIGGMLGWFSPIAGWFASEAGWFVPIAIPLQTQTNWEVVVIDGRYYGRARMDSGWIMSEATRWSDGSYTLGDSTFFMPDKERN